MIELELNKYHVKEANKKIEMVNSFLPEHFTKRGGRCGCYMFYQFHLRHFHFKDRVNFCINVVIMSIVKANRTRAKWFMDNILLFSEKIFVLVSFCK